MAREAVPWPGPDCPRPGGQAFVRRGGLAGHRAGLLSHGRGGRRARGRGRPGAPHPRRGVGRVSPQTEGPAGTVLSSGTGGRTHLSENPESALPAAGSGLDRAPADAPSSGLQGARPAVTEEGRHSRDLMTAEDSWLLMA